ncbi:hypothetical protein BJ165DRAFT_1400048 [Panaeolus papilionaceus]|nr:hypothetical protein BJ165DRAFT_1400048 [Panaeolus papilionaceus]
MDNPKATTLEITGQVSVEVASNSMPENPFIYHSLNKQPSLTVSWDPQGPGKALASAHCLMFLAPGTFKFIEALAGDSQTLSISKNQLASVTQTVTAYRLVNVSQGGNPVFVLDTPGFSDPKISEFETIDMVKNWMEKHNLLVVDRILFLTPITETRLAGSRRRTIEMLKALLILEEDTESMIFVTTMWDTLHNERTRQRAESNFTQLRDEICAVLF